MKFSIKHIVKKNKCTTHTHNLLVCYSTDMCFNQYTAKCVHVCSLNDNNCLYTCKYFAVSHWLWKEANLTEDNQIHKIIYFNAI